MSLPSVSIIDGTTQASATPSLATPAPLRTVLQPSSYPPPPPPPSSGGGNASTISSGIINQELAPVDRGSAAIRFLIGATLYETLVWGGAYGSVGTYQNYFQNNVASRQYGVSSSAATAAIGTLVFAGLHFTPLLTRGLSRSKPQWLKKLAYGSIVASSTCLLIASFFEAQIGVLLVFQGILYGLSSGYGFALVASWLPQWFNEKRGMATGVILSGSGLGGTIFPLMIDQLLNKVGFGWTMRLQAAWNLVILGFAMFLMQPRLPVSGRGISGLSSYVPGGLTCFKHPLGLSLQATLVVQSCAWCSISLYLSSYVTSLGFSSIASTATLSAFNAAAMVGALVTGTIIDRTRYTVAMAASTFLSSLAAFCILGFAHSLNLLILFVLIFGCLGGGFTTFITPMANDMAVLSNGEMGPIYLVFVFARGVAAICGPLLASTMYDDTSTEWSLYGTHGFRGLVIYVGGGTLLASALSLVSHSIRRAKIGNSRGAAGVVGPP